MIPSPIGELTAARSEEGAITELHFAGATPEPKWRRDDSAFDDLRAQLEEYFAGTRRDFDLPLAPTGTPFQLAVWNRLRRIPYGTITTYADIARDIGRPTAFRAVGAANGANPIPIIIPCHRVVGSDGSLTGFGGGIDVKRRLLALESRDALPLFANR